MKKPASVDEYISQVPEEFRGRLNELRSAVKEAVPQAEEKISYGMPYYGYYGRLMYFRLHKNHVGIYFPPPITEIFKKQLEGYETSTSAVRIPLDKKLPIGLIREMAKTRADYNRKNI